VKFHLYYERNSGSVSLHKHVNIIRSKQHDMAKGLCRSANGRSDSYTTHVRDIIRSYPDFMLKYLSVYGHCTVLSIGQSLEWWQGNYTNGGYFILWEFNVNTAFLQQVNLTTLYLTEHTVKNNKKHVSGS